MYIGLLFVFAIAIVIVLLSKMSANEWLNDDFAFRKIIG
jgi:hypothetical protein